jgi:hypothetical protein
MEMLVRALGLAFALSIAGCGPKAHPTIPSVPYMPPYYLAPSSHYLAPVSPECGGPTRC